MNINDVERELRDDIDGFKKKIVVLDDDPTGTQTVHDIPVFTQWSKESLTDGLKDSSSKIFYILTNSRAMSPEETIAVHREIMENLTAASRETGRDFMIISRSDSTLRGHFPLETEIINEALPEDEKADGEILCPFFLEGGRVTAGDVHYVIQNGHRIPAAETEFVKDEVFGYRNSNLKKYIEEKTEGRFKAEDVCSISLESIRNLEVQEITEKLKGVNDFGKIIVNIESYDDLKIFVLALYRAMASGKRFIGRTAASIVKVMGGVEDIPLLTGDDLCDKENHKGGLVMIGSYTNKTTKQLEMTLGLGKTKGIQYDTTKVSDEAAFAAETERVIREATEAICEGITAIVYTGRARICLDSDTKEDILRRSVKISQGVQSIVSGIEEMPRFIIAKGGITSSDIATKAMGIKKAIVAGQISPGIPVWKGCKSGESGSRFNSIPLVIFPGNVGSEEILRDVVLKLMQQ